MNLSPVVRATLPDGKTVRYWYVGWHKTLDAANAGIRHAIGLAREVNATDLVVEIRDDKDRCRYLAKVKREAELAPRSEGTTSHRRKPHGATQTAA